MISLIAKNNLVTAMIARKILLYRLRIITMTIQVLFLPILPKLALISSASISNIKLFNIVCAICHFMICSKIRSCFCTFSFKNIIKLYNFSHKSSQLTSQTIKFWKLLTKKMEKLHLSNMQVPKVKNNFL
jgi:hypothetical protein